MFTWICPQCGREVPPAYTDCPDCAARAAQAAAAAPPPAAEPAAPPAFVPPQAQPPAQPYYPQPPVQPYYPPQQPAPQAPPYYPPQQPQPQAQPSYAPPGPARAGHPGLPIWLLTVVFAFAFVGLGAGIYWVVQSLRGSNQATTPSINVESPAAKAGAKTNPLQKYIEVTGLRFIQDAKKNTVAKFVLINHSEADLAGLAGNVTIWGRTQKSEEDAQGSFSFTTNLGPFESKELTAPVSSKLRIYEMPDWQNVTLDLQITAPAGA